jgi:hypothetical protein
MATRRDVVGFLHLFKGASMAGLLTVRGREKNRQGLIDLGLSAAERREVLMGLEPEDYVAGPKPDDTDDTEEVWEFGKDIGGADVYIKLRVSPDRNKRNVHHALVWSFHPAEFPLKYPLKGGEP